MLAALGLTFPFALPARSAAVGPPPELRFRSFEEAVRRAFAGIDPREDRPCRRVEVGHSDVLQTGVQGCHNDRPFAGFPAGRLRIVGVGSEPGPVVGGVRLYVATVDVLLADGTDGPSRPFDFASLPPAPVLFTHA
jgi:hypothetical protein